ncbi:hypothetical protein MNB_SV-6-1843 [hydrothermal vent metagenome]|uniref:Uncharacterized protein n=1 Tax=hydrothermal vent metagenome TaxID=652676 RepID=A0A1W1C3V0_9ZZZZ
MANSSAKFSLIEKIPNSIPRINSAKSTAIVLHYDSRYQIFWHSLHDKNLKKKLLL